MVPFAKPDIRPEDVKAVSEAVASGWLTTGSRCSLLESALQSLMGVNHVMLTSSLTAAVAPLISALFDPWPFEHAPRAVFPTWTFSSVAMEFYHAGFQIELVDVEPETLLLPIRKYDADVICPTHLFGNQVDLERLYRANPTAVIIDDAAHLSPDMRPDSKYANASLYSFYATKPLCTGEGGAVATNDPQLAHKFKQARLHGISQDVFGRYRDPLKAAQAYDVVRPGWKANMLDSCAAMGLSQLPRLADQEQRRREIIGTYELAFAPIGVKLIAHQPVSSCHLAAVMLPPNVDRHKFQLELAARDIVTSVHFTPLHRFTFWKDRLGYPDSDFPVAEGWANHVMSLPLSSAMTDDDVTEVIRAVWDAMPEAGGYGKATKAAAA